MTTYNNRPYRITEVIFNQKPSSVFEYDGVKVSFKDYIINNYFKKSKPKGD
jgi:hypothetical protein